MLRDGSFFGYGNPKLGKGSEYVWSGKWATLHLLLFSENIPKTCETTDYRPVYVEPMDSNTLMGRLIPALSKQTRLRD